MIQSSRSSGKMCSHPVHVCCALRTRFLLYMFTMTRNSALLAIVVLCLMILTGCAHSPPTTPHDPIEPVNRAMFSFNQTLDHYVLRPVATGYHAVTPDPVESGVGNFFDNVLAPITIVNSLLQLKFASFNIALGRFLINSTVGIGGLFDVASALDIKDPDEDLGQTLGYWGLGRGAYLVLPFFGPSSGRDFVGDVGDTFLNPINYIDSLAARLSLKLLYIVDTRVEFLAFDQVLKQQFDPYIFVRNYYLKSRHAAVQDVADGDVERVTVPDMAPDTATVQ